jgi:predicted Fe-Mo cluster-binding NifX family protein
MKIAVAMESQHEISAHFGRSPSFLILSLINGRVSREELRINDQASHHDRPPRYASRAHAHDHNRFVQLLGDCHSVICLGIGAGARSALERAGIKVLVLKERCSPEEAALGSESGSLEFEPGGCCHGGGHHAHTQP